MAEIILSDIALNQTGEDLGTCHSKPALRSLFIGAVGRCGGPPTPLACASKVAALCVRGFRGISAAQMGQTG